MQRQWEVRNINSTNGVSWTTTGHTGEIAEFGCTPEGILPPEGLATTPRNTPENEVSNRYF